MEAIHIHTDPNTGALFRMISEEEFFERSAKRNTPLYEYDDDLVEITCPWCLNATGGSADSTDDVYFDEKFRILTCPKCAGEFVIRGFKGIDCACAIIPETALFCLDCQAEPGEADWLCKKTRPAHTGEMTP